MANYNVELTPAITDSQNLDTSIVNGASLQKSAFLTVYNGSDCKVVEVQDGDSFDDVIPTVTDGIVEVLGTYRVVDNSADGLTKRILFFANNVEDFVLSLSLWKSYPLVTGGTTDINIVGDVYLTGTIGGRHLTPVKAFNGKKYGIRHDKFVVVGNASSGAYFQVVNNSEDDLHLITSKAGNDLQSFDLEPDDIVDIRYRPVYYVYVSTDMTNPPAQEEINTQISLLGVETADFVITYVGENYVISLNNIVYA